MDRVDGFPPLTLDEFIILIQSVFHYCNFGVDAPHSSSLNKELDFLVSHLFSEKEINLTALIQSDFFFLPISFIVGGYRSRLSNRNNKKSKLYECITILGVRPPQ
jgi:hypothetical protein